MQLPEPESIGLAHSKCVVDSIVDAINRQGPLSLGDYMQRVLYAPGLGYYMTGNQKFGATGDFTTAPETSSLFGRCIAGQVQQVLATCGGDVLEIGAGSGALALSILQSISPRESMSRRYYFLEPSAELAQRQRDLLQSHLPTEVYASCCWLDTLPGDFVGVILANEVLDAMPVEQFVIGSSPDEIHQTYVDNTSGALALVQRPAADGVRSAARDITRSVRHELSAGYRSEVNLLLTPWLQSLSDCLQRGLLLLIDYGFPRQEYYLPERINGTLRCYYRHRMHEDTLLYPGLQDITSDVDFTLVAMAAESAEFDLHGYTSQAQFLLGSGLLDYAAAVDVGSEQQRLAIAQQIRKLTLASEMGERFQVMGLSKRLDVDMPGFSNLDLSYRL